MADVLALVDDLFFQAKMMETAKQVGVALRVVSSGDALVQAAAAQAPALVLVDLNARQGALAGLTQLCAAGQAPSRGVSLPRADRFGRAGARGRLRAGAPAVEIYRRSRRDFAPGEIVMASPRKTRAGWSRAAIAAALLVAMAAACAAGARAASSAARAARGRSGRRRSPTRCRPPAARTTLRSRLHLTAENAAAFRALPEPQQTALLKRFILLDDPGGLCCRPPPEAAPKCAAKRRAWLRTCTSARPTCTRISPSSPPKSGSPAANRARCASDFVREGGQWKLLSVGLLLLDLPAMAKQWDEADLQKSENDAIAALAKIAEALDKYQQAYGKLPETLDPLGPPGGDGASPEHAGLLAAELAAGSSGGYSFRYVIVPAKTEGDDSERDKAAGFALAATPIEYGKGGRRFFLPRFEWNAARRRQARRRGHGQRSQIAVPQ